MRDPSRRRLLGLAVGLPVLAGGGYEAYRRLQPEPSVKRKSSIGNVTWELIDDQPSLDAGHGTMSATLITSESDDEQVTWENWRTINDDEPPRVTDFDTYFLVIVVGVAKAGYGLDETREPSFDGDTVEHTYSVVEDTKKDDDGLVYHYHVHRWELAGRSPPENVVLNEE
jgi:hypothetical protein